MTLLRAGARALAGVGTGLLVFAVSATAEPPPGGTLEKLRERADLMSGLDTLDRYGAVPPTLESAPAESGSPFSWSAPKRELSRFAPAGGPGRPPFAAANVGIGTDPGRDENEPTVAADPRDPDVLVAGSHSFDPVTQINRCVAFRSRDGGSSWSAPVALPQLTPDSFCSDPVLAYPPDGRRVYYAYMDIKLSESVVGDPENPETITFSSDFDILVSRSSDGGRHWSRPVVALDGDPFSVTIDFQTGEELALDPGFDYDKPWIGTHVPAKGRDGDNRKRVYVSATRFDNSNPGFACAIEVTGSKDRARDWSPPVELDTSSGDCGAPIVVQGSRPSGGLGDDLLVAWYNSGTDGARAGSFEIRTAFSKDARRFDAPVTAARDSFEAPFLLGPFEFYHRWWGTMWPDVEIGADGRAHIVYTHDPEENGITFVDPETGEEIFFPEVSTTAEDGDIRYVTSRRRRAGRRYGSWSAPVTLNDDGLVRAQGYPALETAIDDGKTTLHVLWMDHRLSPEVRPDPDRFGESSNLFYDVFATRSKGRGWTRNRRVTERRSISDFIFVGDYNDLATSGDDLVFGIWTDRRHQTSIGAFLDQQGNLVFEDEALEDNVFGDRLGGDDD
jgi:hypothetical protein